MINHLRRATTRLAIWSASRHARRALSAAMYADYGPGRDLIERLAPGGPTVLVPVATVWADAYLAVVPSGEVEPVTPLDKWLAELISYHAAQNRIMVHSLIAHIPRPLVRHHLEALLCLAAAATLAHDDPDPVWP